MKQFKFAILFMEVVLLGGLGFVMWGMTPFATDAHGPVEIYQTHGQVQRFDINSGRFVDAAVDDQITAGQQLLTRGGSWARVSFFDDGTSMQIDPFTSVSLLGTGEQNGIQFAKLHLDVGRLFVMPFGSVVYVETNGGIVFVDVPASVVNISVDTETNQTMVFCLEGVCKINNPSGSIMLSKGQEAVLGNETQPPMVIDLVEDQFSPGTFQDLEKAKNDLLASLSEIGISESSAVSSEQIPVDCGPPQEWVIYSVLPGDSFDSLLEMFSMDGKEFKKANCLGDSETVVAGLNLFVPDLPVESLESAAILEARDPKPTEKVILPQPTAVQIQPTPAPTEQAPEISEVDTLELRNVPVIRNRDYNTNPGMGWQYKGGSFPITSPAETVAYASRSRISWMVLNPAEGVFDWTALDSQLQTAISQGKQFSFRVYTMIGEEFGGHQVPQWVLEKGANLLPNGEPNYSNCTYQEEWGKFVKKLTQRYDGNPNIAFIDISGYGNFNEWSWQDTQTEWDEVWADHYANGTASRDTMSNLDSFARRILADMFIGGSYQDHQCSQQDGTLKTVSYSFSGFTKTQLLMPYAGTIQSSQYVFSQRKDVGFRFDCLGRTSSNKIVSPDRFGTELSKIWPKAPVVFETCQPGEFSLDSARYLAETAHASLVHNPNIDLDTAGIMNLVEPLGYQYLLKSFRYSFKVPAGGKLTASMEWQNIGLAPSYPKMGQHFELHVYFYDRNGNQVVDYLVPEDVASWMPAVNYGDTPPVYQVNVAIELGDKFLPGIYYADVKIIDTRTGKPIWTPFSMDSK